MLDDAAARGVHRGAPGLSFHWLHVRARDGQVGPLFAQVQSCARAVQGGQFVGVFAGLFGFASTELFVLLGADGPAAASAAAVRAAFAREVEVVDALALHATARPRDAAPLTRDGLYVFRFFDVRERDVDEVVRLSRAAWETFENPAGDRDVGYASEPVGLFRPREVSGPDGYGRMLLLTWYDGFESWERSRSPAPEATANFRRRAALTRSTIAYAARLAQA